MSRRRGEKVSDLTTQRLSLYLRCLEELDRQGTATISSQHLADRFHFSSAQIRKDLATFGEFGVRGVGYSVDKLRKRLTRILGLDRGTLAPGAIADITIIDPDREWTVDADELASKSKNSPFLGMKMKGRAAYTVVGGKIVYDSGILS